MALVTSVSGVRGTIGGVPGKDLTPVDIVAFASAYGTWLKSRQERSTIVLGRDGRISGRHVTQLVTETLRAMGIHVIDAGLSTTPSVEVYVPHVKAQGGIIITASHNPREWNALKFLDGYGEFISPEAGDEILKLSKQNVFHFNSIDAFGEYREVNDVISYHVDRIMALDLVDADAIRQKGFHITVDCINSTGAFAIPALLDALGCSYALLNGEVNGEFAHNPEPLAQHLTELCAAVKETNAVIGIAVDPDVDRLALVDEYGKYLGEEYTLVAVADYVLQHTPGPCVSNLSSSMALKTLALKYHQKYSSSKVGEVHVVSEMKRTSAVIGGEGNGGVIFPGLHYGRDALVGIALLLSHMARSGKMLSQLREQYADFTIAKHKIDLPQDIDVQLLLKKMKDSYDGYEFDMRDGIKMMKDNSWILLRASNTEPIVRIFAESEEPTISQALVKEAEQKLRELLPK